MKDISIPEHMEREVKSIVLVSLGAFLFFFYVFSAGVEDVYTALTAPTDSTVAMGEVAGVSTETDEERVVEVRLNNSKLGEGVLEYTFPTKTSFAGSELHFVINGALDVEDILCEPGFMCIDERGDGVIDLTILRLPEYADLPLIGEHDIATIVYDHVTSGELVINDGSVERSTLVEVGSDANILNSEVTYLFVGNYNAE